MGADPTGGLDYFLGREPAIRHCELGTGLRPTPVNETGAELAAGWAMLPDRALMVGLVAVGKRSVAH